MLAFPHILRLVTDRHTERDLPWGLLEGRPPVRHSQFGNTCPTLTLSLSLSTCKQEAINRESEIGPLHGTVVRLVEISD